MTDRTLHCEPYGRGPPLVLLHGFTGTGRALDGIAHDLSADYTTITPDLPGHGRSAGLSDAGAYDFEGTLERLVATLGAAGHARAHWLGYSMGARLALGCAVRHPHCVASLVLVGGRAGIADPVERAARRRTDEALAVRIETQGMEAFVDEWQSQPLFATQRRLGPALLAEQRRLRLANDPREIAASLRGLGPAAQPPLFDALADVTAPVLLVAGALDRVFVEHARGLARQLPHAELCEIADAGHAVHLEQPAAFLRATRDFLRRVAGREPCIPLNPVEETVS